MLVPPRKTSFDEFRSEIRAVRQRNPCDCTSILVRVNYRNSHHLPEDTTAGELPCSCSIGLTPLRAVDAVNPDALGPTVVHDPNRVTV